MVWVPCASLRGNLRCSPKAGSRSNSPSAQTIASPDPLLPALLGPARRVGGPGAGADSPRGSGGDALCASSPEPDPESDFFPQSRLAGPSSADGGGVKGGSCLSEASSADPRRNRAAQVARSEAKGPGQSGRLFFGDFLLATQKKVTCRRATPGLLAHHGSQNNASSRHTWIPDQVRDDKRGADGSRTVTCRREIPGLLAIQRLWFATGR